jgi:hypothetical protein
LQSFRTSFRLGEIEIVELLDDLDFPWRQVDPRAAQEGVDIGPFDRQRTEAIAALAPP